MSTAVVATGAAERQKMRNGHRRLCTRRMHCATNSRMATEHRGVHGAHVQTFVSLTHDLPSNSDIGTGFTEGTLTLSAEIVDANYAEFSIACVPIPEPDTYALMGCGLAVTGPPSSYAQTQSCVR